MLQGLVGALIMSVSVGFLSIPLGFFTFGACLWLGTTKAFDQ